MATNLDVRVLRQRLAAIDAGLDMLGKLAEGLLTHGDKLLDVRREFAAVIEGLDVGAIYEADSRAVEAAAAMDRWADTWAPALRQFGRSMQAAQGLLVPLPRPATKGE